MGEVVVMDAGTPALDASAPPPAVIVIGAVGDPTSAERAVALAERDPDIWATVATHPHEDRKSVV